MSTRCNIKVTDSMGYVLWFYRHSDGYPEGAMPLLKTFMQYVKDGKIRDNAPQASGWLILLGAQEYGQSLDRLNKSKGGNTFDDWKVGAIEPTTEQHGDIEWLYTLDLAKKKIIITEI